MFFISWAFNCSYLINHQVYKVSEQVTRIQIVAELEPAVKIAIIQLLLMN